MKKGMWLLAVLLCLALALAAVFGPGIYRGVKMLDLVLDVWNREEASLDIRMDGEMELRLDWTQTQQGRIFILESSGVQVCFCNGVIYLENGKGFDFTETTRKVTALLQEPWKFVPLLKTERQGNSYRAVLEEPALQVTLEPGNDGFGSAQVSFGGKEFGVIVQTGRSARIVPKVITDAVSAGQTQGSGDLTQALLRLLGAWAELGSRNITAMDLHLSADCGPISLADTLDARIDRNLGIGYVEKQGKGLYFKGGKVCTAEGKLLADAQTDVEVTQMLGMAYLLLLNGDFTCQGNVYSLELDQKGIEDLAYTIVPAARDLSIGFESGRIELALEDGKLDKIAVSCTGTLDLILTTVKVSIGTELEMKEASVFFIPQEVLEVLR